MRARRIHKPQPRSAPVGVVLAGGAGRRMGGAKAAVKLAGRPLISYPLDAVWRALGNVAVVAKIGSELPELPGLTVWIEPDSPQHPLVGVVHALELAGGRPVFVCAGDLPLVSAALVRQIAGCDPRGAPAVLASGNGRVQPLLGCYQPEARALLARWAGASAEEVRMTELAGRLGARTFNVEDEVQLFNVNSPDDLLLASAIISRRSRTSSAPAG